MKKRLEDRLIELAFDDGSTSVQNEFAANPAAKARLGEYRAMRAALGQLREMPEHQLSTERLREALLHRGLKRRRAFPWQALGYGSVACSMFFCAFFVSRFLRTAHGPTQLVDPRNELAVAAKPDLAAQIPFFAPSSADAHSTHTVANLHIRHHRVRDYRPIPGEILAFNRQPHSSGMRLINPAGSTDPSATLPRGLDGDNQPIETSGRATSAPARTHDAVLIIDQQTDADTGLDTAEEKKGNTDVLVGG